jgi:PhnB protein
MSCVNPYLHFEGNCEEAFDFYKSVFGGEFAAQMRWKDMNCENPPPESEGNKIMHVSFTDRPGNSSDGQ